ncbi:putative mitochondrial hypothetical protein [Leptomonas pyrrhocoris]|uniref:Uncharacterized protein n=1 Tax=Leptomonas pyrrhocoris TaxID=157538 RepID=A0A0M9FZT5_LEPPY|nr:putative mitochondrial hypothetical protein [Leptomonas pyrrhocoris]KPA79343.1 putative mitochondrial hypothetical protein [Leptomonas pyrrhocoris]|eukprot:XP_015657782.1 putative mitochondrial hypothetical protein [Leptomonas pyrrhocoris]
MKKRTAKTPKGTRRTPVKARGKKAPASEAELASPPSPPDTPPSPSPALQSLPPSSEHLNAQKATASPPAPASSGRRMGAVFLLISVTVLVLWFCSGGGATHPHHPCACATAASVSNPLAKALLSRRSGVSGVHWHQRRGDADRLDFALNCRGVLVAPLHGPFASVDQLRAETQKSFGSQKSRCVVWVTSPEAIQKVANALKELLENNALGGRPVVPPQARGTLVVKSAHPREELKNILPHRVVHMLTDVH